MKMFDVTVIFAEEELWRISAKNKKAAIEIAIETLLDMGVQEEDHLHIEANEANEEE